MTDASLTALYLSDPAMAQRLRRQRMAEDLVAPQQSEPIRTHGQGAAKVVRALLGGWELGQIDREMRGESDRMRREEEDFRTSRPSARSSAPAAAPSSVPVAAGAPMPAPAAPAARPSGGAEAPADLMPFFEEASRETGIPVPLLVAQARQESNFNPGAVGRAGEVGLMQIMPSTARQPGFGVPPADPATLSDPRTNIMFGARYLAGRAGQGDWNDPAFANRALASYNGGGDPRYVENVRRWMPQQPAASGATIPVADGPVQTAGGGGAMPGGATPVAAQSGPDDATLEWLQRGLTSSNPRIRSMAEAEMKILQLRQRSEGNVSLREAVGPEGPGLYQVDNRGNLGRRVGGVYQAPQQPAQPGETERLFNEYIELEKQRVAGTLSQEAALRRDLLVRRLSGQDQIVGGPGGFMVNSPAPLPTLNGATGSGNTLPASGGAPPGAMQGATPMPQVAVPGAPAQPTAGNVPGSDASVGSVPNQRQGQTVTTQNGRTATFIPGQTPPPANYQWSPDNTTAVPIPGGPADQTRQALTEPQSKANMFGQNMQSGHQILSGLTPPSNATIIAWRNAPEAIVNMGLSSNDQRYFNAVRQFAAGILRKETGAAFAPSELLDVQSRFFPLPGDSPETIRQKAAMREQAIALMEAEVPGGFRRGATGGPSQPANGSSSRIMRFDAQGNLIQ